MINAYLVNRNLVTTLKDTVEFLKKEPRVQIHIIDNDSTYQPCLDYYNECGVFVHYMKENCGPYVAWDHRLSYLHRDDEPFIVADSDCCYNHIPSDWLDKMLQILNDTDAHKASFSIRIDNVPDTQIGKAAKAWEKQFWAPEKFALTHYRTVTDTTFSLYRPKSGFSYDSARLIPPYILQHEPFYLPDKINEEWQYYRDHAGSASTWFSRRKALGI
jgi:hypothetical protein